MNYLVSDDYVLQQDYPENITNTIRSGHSTCLRFNRNGDYLASGRVDGTVVIWDLDTMGVARKLRGHSKSVSSLSWSSCGRYLLSSCQGWKVILWDLADGKRHREVRFRAPVYIAELNPCNTYQFVASIFEDQPMIVDTTDPIDIKHILPSKPKRPSIDDGALKEKWAKEDSKQMTTVAIYTQTGDHVVAGTNKGWINIIDTKTREVIFSQKPCTGVITTLRLTQSGDYRLLLNAQDRIIRTFQMPDLSTKNLDLDTIQLADEHKFQDMVNRLQWNHVTFSATGEYVAASTYNNHELYIWEQRHSSLVRILEGPKEEQGTIEWHPNRALLAACGLETGRISIWSVTSPQRWSALAPDFVEVEENEQYVEEEDEFDIHPQEEITKRRLDLEDEDIDVLAKVSTGVITDEDSFKVPILYDLGESDSEEEFVAVSTGTMRRRSPGEGRGDGDGVEEKGSKKAPGGKSRARKKG